MDLDKVTRQALEALLRMLDEWKRQDAEREGLATAMPPRSTAFGSSSWLISVDP